MAGKIWRFSGKPPYFPRRIKTRHNLAHQFISTVFMVKTKLHLDHNPEPMDVADALAIALCHNHQFMMADL